MGRIVPPVLPPLVNSLDPKQFKELHQPYFITLVGPTAVGKTDLAIRLAQKLGTEILSADSMQVYRGMDIGTAKPTLTEQALVHHHLIDVVAPWDMFSVSSFIEKAQTILEQYRRVGNNLVVCGGTGLYLQGLFSGITSAPPPDHDFRSRLEMEAQEKGIPYLYQKLKTIDPEAAQKIHVNDLKRIIRAIEIHHLTGMTRTQFEKQQPCCDYQQHVLWIGLIREWKELDQRINNRVDKMFKMGLLDEVKSLMDAGWNEHHTSQQALGYKETIEYMKGIRSLTETIDLIKQKTRRYARRQLTWFRANPKISWFLISDENQSPDRIVEEILKNCPSS